MKILLMILTVCSLQIANAQPVIKVQSAKSYGTGFYISKDQTITAGHVCSNKFAMYYKDDYRQVYVTKKVIISKKYDLCYIKWDRENPSAQILPSAKEHQSAKMVSAMGYPEGIFTMAANVQGGYVKDEGRWHGQAQLNMRPGSSGSPIVNEHGQVIGVLVIIRYKDKMNLYETLSTLHKFLNDEVLNASK